MRKRTLIFFAICLMIVLAMQPTASAGVLIGKGGTSGGGSPGTWYVGATPPNVDYTKPVLVFVHGKGGWSGSWWEPTVYHGTNDMYAYAYNNGYRTAFVDLYPGASMWTNGQLLNRQLNEITAYFGVQKVILVAHSKGGVDANAASVHYGASGKISRVITLGSPHGGSPLADMAYSTWTWWLGELLGQRNDATYVLQTGYMAYFRSVTDGRDAGVPYYTLSGDKCGPLFSALWMGCAAIWGEDDGLVPVWSARKPGGIHVREGAWDHDEIRMGSRVWPYVSPLMQTAATEPPAAARTGSTSGAPGNLILRGGTTSEHGTASFPVESGVRGAAFTFLASSPSFAASLVGPDGSIHKVSMTGQVPAGDFFGGAHIGTVTVKNPAAGTWTLNASADAETGYAMLAELDTDLQAVLDLGQPVATPGGKQSLQVSFRGRAPAVSRAEAAIAKAGQRPMISKAGGVLQAQWDLPEGNTIHNVTVTVTGTLPDGTAFERTLVTSYAAVAPADRGMWR
jgi:pimeloyl-ACP methyl ester carboxylesterase